MTQTSWSLKKPGRFSEQEFEFVECAYKQVASGGDLYLRSEPALLDRFIAEQPAVSAGTSEEAYLEAI
jgi:hypothetical protein